MLKDAGLLGKQAEKNGIRVDKIELNSIVKSGEEKRRMDLQRIKNQKIFSGKENKNDSQEFIQFSSYSSDSYGSLSDFLNNPDWEENKD